MVSVGLRGNRMMRVGIESAMVEMLGFFGFNILFEKNVNAT